eukprot:6173880-Pleurochrysis_carterae.AAC.4
MPHAVQIKIANEMSNWARGDPTAPRWRPPGPVAALLPVAAVSLTDAAFTAGGAHAFDHAMRCRLQDRPQL